MKKTISLVSLGILLCSNSMQAFADADTSNVTNSKIAATTNSIDSWMPDKGLQKAVATQLNKEVNDITQEDMGSLTDLMGANNQGITSLKGLEYAKNLVRLNLTDNSITDVAPITGLIKLKYLSLTNNVWQNQYPQTISNLSELGNLINLTELNLTECGVSNIDFMSNLTHLTKAGLKNNAIADLSPLKSLPFLERVDASRQNVYLDTLTLKDVDTVNVSYPEIKQASGAQLSLKKFENEQSDLPWFKPPMTFNGETTYNQEDNSIVWKGLEHKNSSDNLLAYFEGTEGVVQFSGVIVQPYNLSISTGLVTAKYVDTDGNKISDDVVKSGNVGDPYTTEQKAIDGYTFKEVQGSSTGIFTDQAQNVTYVYTKDPVAGGDVTAKYVDTVGNKISDDVVKSGNVGDAYTTEQKGIDGYTFKDIQGNGTGTFTDQAQNVTYVYTKNTVILNPTPDDHSKTKPSAEKKPYKDKVTLPQTGDNDGLSMLGMISGLFLVLGTSLMILFKRKRQD